MFYVKDDRSEDSIQDVKFFRIQTLQEIAHNHH